MKIIFWLFWVLIVLNIVDLSLTYNILQLGGGEANPIANFFVHQFGVLAGMLIAKAPPLIGLGYLIYRFKDVHKDWVAILMGIVTGVYLGVIGYSISILLILMEII